MTEPRLSGDVVERTRGRIAGVKNRIADLTCRLVDIATENPPGRNYDECVKLLASELDTLGLPYDIREVAHPDGPPRFILRAGVGSGPVVYLHGHYDVVPASRPGQFQADIENGRIVGRGAADMKGAIAAKIYALEALRDLPLHGRVELVLVPDEETGGEYGSGYLVRSGRLDRNGVAAILGEPTGGIVWNASRGAVTLRVSITGTPAHVGLQFQGRNAFEGALPILNALNALKDQVEQRETRFHIEPPAARRGILMLGGEVSGAGQFNVVPDRFAFTVERRFNPEERLEDEKRVLLKTIERVTPRDLSVEVEIIQEAESSATSADSALGQRLAWAVERVTGAAPRYEMCPGLLETRFYARHGIPSIAYGPGDLKVAHGPAEYVELDRLVESAQIYALSALGLLADSGPPA